MSDDFELMIPPSEEALAAIERDIVDAVNFNGEGEILISARKPTNEEIRDRIWFAKGLIEVGKSKKDIQKEFLRRFNLTSQAATRYYTAAVSLIKMLVSDVDSNRAFADATLRKIMTADESTPKEKVAAVNAFMGLHGLLSPKKTAFTDSRGRDLFLSSERSAAESLTDEQLAAIVALREHKRIADEKTKTGFE